MSQILDERNVDGISDANNNSDNKNAYIKAGFNTYNITSINARASVGDISGMGDASGISGADNNFDDKNTYTKADFRIYNITNANANAYNISDTRDASDTGGANNNANNKNAHAKIGFSTFNIANTNASDSNNIGEEVSNNTNNTGASQSSKIDRTNKGGLDRADKSGVNGLNKGEVDGANKSRIDRANIEIGKKANIRAVASTNNSTDGGNKITDQHIGLASLAFIALAAANYTGNSNFANLKKTLSSAVTSISDKFLAIFAAFTNITLEKKSNIYKFNLFLFATNRQ